MTNRSPRVPLTGSEMALVILMTAAIAAAYASLPFWVSAVALGGAAVVAWRLAANGHRWYAAALALPIPHTLMPLRLSMADVLALPLVAQEGLRWSGKRERLQSTLLLPLLLLVVVTAGAILVGYYRTGGWSTWALVNKGAGLLFQVAVMLALIRRVQTLADVQSLARWFVVGVSVANAAALVAVVIAIAGWPNAIYSSRLFGWMAQPTVTGGLLMVAAMIELGSLASRPTPGERRLLRWVNVWLLGLSLLLTVSRSTWISVGVAAIVLAGALAWTRQDRSLRVSHLTAVSVWFLVPFLLLGNVLLANLRAGVTLLPSDRAAELRAEVASQCEADPSLEFCAPLASSSEPARPVAAPSSTPGSIASSTADGTPPGDLTAAAGSPAPAAPSAPAAPDTPAVGPASAVPEVSGSLMNARGLNDRVAILRVAWHEYTRDVTSVILGIGLGTFYATSADDFGVPLIIHNTFAWYLIEFGPLGLAVVLWIWTTTAWNLWTAMQPGREQRELAIGLMAALAGFAIFCVFNEGFYQRQLWLIMVLADRLVVVVAAARLRPVELPPYVAAPARCAV